MDGLHPEVRRLWDEFRARGIVPADPQVQDLATARAAARRYHAHLSPDRPAVALVEDVVAPAPGRSVPIRLFRPDRRGELPVLVYFHGGGFVLNGIDTHDRLLRLLARRTGMAVAAGTYRLAPEHRFPAPIEDALTAIAWLRAEGGARGLDAARLAVAGDSAGANLALAVTLALRDRGLPLPDAGLLFYGMFSADLDTPSHHAYGDGRFGLTTARMEWFWRQYLADPAQCGNPLAAPLGADLAGLPPQVVVGAGVDCLLDDSRNLAAALRAAGTPVAFALAARLPHSFLQLTAFVGAADTALTDAALALQAVWPTAERRAG